MKIQLKRSSVLDGGAAKEPTAAQMEYGELAVNYNDSDPAIFIKDSADSIIRIGGIGSISDDGQVEIPSGSNPPATPEDGNLWYNPEDGRLYVYYNDGNSSQWVDASPDGWNAAEDGASIHVGDTPPATPLEGSLWWNTTDNTLYIYYIDSTSEQWVTASPSGSIDVDDFVAVAGDNMTGDLTLGTDPSSPKISLNTDGSADFAGTVDANRFESNWPGATGSGSGSVLAGSLNVKTPSTGLAVIVRDETTSGDINASISGSGSAFFASHVKIGGTTSAPKIGLYSNGSCEFNGRALNSDQWRSTSSNGAGFFHFADRSDHVIGDLATIDLGTTGFLTRNSAAVSGALSSLQLQPQSDSAVTRATIIGYSADGNTGNNASFGICQGAQNLLRFNLDEIGNVGIGGTLPSAPNISLNANGSSVFADDVQSGGDANAGVADGVRLRSRGLVQASASMAANTVWTGYQTGTTGATSSIFADGSASFAGGDGVSSQGFGVNAAGTIQVRNDTSSNNVFQVRSADDQNPTIYFTANGGAVFKGAVQTKNGVVTPSMVLQLEADDDTKYTSTTDVDEEGNETVTRVYNGTTLDVKDRIQNVLARMDAIEANEITDDATDSALLTLIANLSARLDERDTQIAALTARVSTLES